MHAVEMLEQGGLAAAVRTEQGDEAVGGEVGGDAVEDFLCTDAKFQIMDIVAQIRT